MEDAGYETAKIKGADALATTVTMLRQRGLVVVEIAERVLPSPLLPLPARAPTDTEHGTSEAAVVACLSRSPSISLPRSGGGAPLAATSELAAPLSVPSNWFSPPGLPASRPAPLGAPTSHRRRPRRGEL